MNHTHTKESLIAFEERVQKKWRSGDLPYLLHLSEGNEAQLLDIFEEAKEGDWFFVSHRNHLHSLLSGIPEEQVFQNICDGGSMFSYSRKCRVFSSAILAGNCGIAVGTAIALKESGSKNRCWVFLGDGAEENGHFYESVFYVTGHQLPVTFVIEDNNKQVDTPKEIRRGMSSGLLDAWPCVRRYRYISKYPHAGDGQPGTITFKTK